jgi:hypothetical protein
MIAITLISIFILYSSPDWVIVVLSAAAVLWQGFISLRYFAMKFIAGNLVTRIPNHRNFSRVLIASICSIAAGVLRFIEPPKGFPLVKIYSFEALLIAFGVFSIIELFRNTEIRENGILHETGIFYHWKYIESLGWTNEDDALTIKLRNLFLKKNATLVVSSLYKEEISESFARYTKNNYAG